jgi:Zn-dependent protease with chaperone function
MFGRELSHIAQKHMRSHIMTNIVTPWVVRACLIASNTIISTMLHAIVQRSEITRSIKLSSIVANIGPAMQFLLRNPIMESIYINRICTYASRRREKQADIEAARRFNCAQSGISLFQKIDAFNHRAYDIFDRLYYRIINGQPTPAQRIAYLRPIAEAQRAQAPGPEV